MVSSNTGNFEEDLHREYKKGKIYDEHSLEQNAERKLQFALKWTSFAEGQAKTLFENVHVGEEMVAQESDFISF